MSYKPLAMLCLTFGLLSLGLPNGEAAERQAIKLPADLLDLLRAEMREITKGVQDIALSLAVADWEAIRETGAKIHSSYLLEQKLSPAQLRELEKALPQPFKQLDAEFHQRAEKLADAATAHDAEQVVFHYSRLLENCAQCHAAYASRQFPGFFSPAAAEHAH